MQYSATVMVSLVKWTHVSLAPFPTPAGRAWFDSHVGRPLVSVTDDLLRAALSCWHILQPSNRAESVRS